MKRQKEFLACFSGIARHNNRYEVFRDFVTLASHSILNAVLKSEAIENEYLQIIGRYHEDDIKLFPKLLAIVVQALDEELSDFLGKVYMALDVSSHHTGQFFTPCALSRMMAQLLCPDFEQLLCDQEYITLHEPSSGAGGMVINYVAHMISKGYNPQKQLFVSCIDVDPLVARICYVQLSLLGIPAEVVIGNALTLKLKQTLHTPMYYMDGWDIKLRSKSMVKKVVNLCESCPEPLIEEQTVEEFCLTPLELT